jgi:hypothetical protein
MLTPREAYNRLLAAGLRGMDDPQGYGPPVRWYFDQGGVLCSCAWRSPCPREYPEFRLPREDGR